MHFETRAIHDGQEPDPRTGAVIVPIYQTSTFAQDGPGQHRGHEYSRSSNPTRDALEECLASLEGASHGLSFASGMAAISTIMTTLEPGDHVVSTADVYGGTFRVFDKVFRRFGIEYSAVDTGDLDALEAAITAKTKMAWVETPTNPMLGITDLAAVAERVRPRGIKLAVDNTFMSPALQRPLELGADLVVHSTTKYIGGHSDVVGGFVATSDDALHEKLRFNQNAVGAVSGPFDAWLTLRGIKTLALRMAAHEKNAKVLSEWLEKQPTVEAVIYPGLKSHPGHEIQKRQASGFGGIISFRVRGGLPVAAEVCRQTRLFILAESLGGVESLIEHPAIMTHASVPQEQREARGIDDGLIRISVGIEHPEDLKADLARALQAGTSIV